MIEFKNAQIGYTNVLLNVENLTLMKGSIYALIGANGSGKTTLLNSIIGKTKLQNGQLLLNGIEHNLLSSKELSKTIAFVESRFDGVEFLTVRDYVALGRTPYTNTFGRLTPADYKQIDHALQLMGLEELSERFTTKISDGERQLTAMARALVQETPIIILDEPTAFLDYGNRIKLIQLLNRVTELEKKCILFSTHDIDLCLEEKLTILIINQKKKTLEPTSSTTKKEELLQIGFSIE
jgi:iron complex transport system ATP-binding protein